LIATIFGTNVAENVGN